MKKLIIFILIMVLSGAGYWWYQNQTASNNKTVQYTTSLVTSEAIISSITGSGNVAASNSADVSPKVSGEISEIKVQIGDTVDEGDVVAVLKNNDLYINQDAARIAYEQAQQTLNRKELEIKQAWETVYNLEDQEENDANSASDLQFDLARQTLADAELAYQQAQNMVSSKQEAYQESSESIQALQVLAPISGTVVSIDAEIGDSIGSSSGTTQAASSSNNSSIMSIANLTTLVAEIPLSEVDIANIITGQVATLAFDAVKNYTATGKVTNIDYEGTNSQGVVDYTVTITLDTANSKIKPGMSVDASIILTKKDNVLSVPNAAIKYRGGEPYVTVLENGQPSDASVEIGIASDDLTEIVNGLIEGQAVVTATVDGTTTSEINTNSQNGGFNFPGVGGGPGGVRGVQTFQTR